MFPVCFVANFISVWCQTLRMTQWHSTAVETLTSLHPLFCWIFWVFFFFFLLHFASWETASLGAVFRVTAVYLSLRDHLIPRDPDVFRLLVLHGDWKMDVLGILEPSRGSTDLIIKSTWKYFSSTSCPKGVHHKAWTSSLFSELFCMEGGCADLWFAVRPLPALSESPAHLSNSCWVFKDASWKASPVLLPISQSPLECQFTFYLLARRRFT